MKDKNMIYENINDEEQDIYSSDLYWYIKKSDLENFRNNLFFVKSVDGMCWVCESLNCLLDLMEQTVANMNEYIIIKFRVKSNRRIWYTKVHDYDENKNDFVNDIIMKFDLLKIGTKGDLKIKKNFTEISMQRAYNIETGSYGRKDKVSEKNFDLW